MVVRVASESLNMSPEATLIALKKAERLITLAARLDAQEDLINNAEMAAP